MHLWMVIGLRQYLALLRAFVSHVRCHKAACMFQEVSGCWQDWQATCRRHPRQSESATGKSRMYGRRLWDRQALAPV